MLEQPPHCPHSPQNLTIGPRDQPVGITLSSSRSQDQYPCPCCVHSQPLLATKTWPLPSEVLFCPPSLCLSLLPFSNTITQKHDLSRPLPQPCVEAGSAVGKHGLFGNPSGPAVTGNSYITQLRLGVFLWEMGTLAPVSLGIVRPPEYCPGRSPSSALT